MKDLIEELYLTNRSFVTEDYETCLEYIDENELSLTYHEYPSGTEIWDSWVIPQKWSVNHAYVEADGELILSFEDHPLHLIGYSDSFEGWVTREELTDHIHTHDNPDAIPWHFRQNYRPWDSEWGFCASQQFVDSLGDDEYYVSIDTSFESGAMTVAEHYLPGELDETIVFIAHLDHTGMANDDLSGVAAGIEIMRRLQNREERRYSYKLLLVQEMIGSAAYLADHDEAASTFKFGVFLEMLGNDNRLLLQESFTGDSRLDAIARHTLEALDVETERDGFRAQIGNDEAVFESPGFEVPTISVSRFPYPEYHTHFDDPSIIHEDQLEGGVSYVLDIVDILERDFVPTRTFKGLPSFANPKYDLYLDPHDLPNVEATPNSDLDGFRDRMVRYLEGDHSAFDIAQEFGLEFDFVCSYLRKFEEKDLVETEPVPVYSPR